MKKYLTQDKETGTIIDEFNTYEEAENAIEKYEIEDGESVEFYEIKEKVS